MQSSQPSAQTVDLLIVGGGINGSGIARDAVGRGLSVLLVEKDDLAAHTSQWSSKLIHGGLRYLEHYEFRLVGESLAEREVMLRVAPHLIRPLQFVLPHEPHLRPRWMLRAGLFLYDRLGGWSGQKQSLPKSFATKLTSAKWGAGLHNRFTDGFVYSDAQVDDARLVVENAKDARRRGADVRVGTELVGAKRVNQLWEATLRDAGGTEYRVNARAIVNAAGPWVKSLLARIDTPPTKETVKHIKGSHLIVPRIHEQNHAYILQNKDGRIVFVIPYLDRFSLIGTTDVEVTEFDAPHISDEETKYLLALANTYLAHPISEDDIEATYAGVRPLYDDGDDDPSAITRDYTLTLDTANDGAPLLNIYGGKITTYRKLAEHALNRLLPFFPKAGKSSWTDTSLQAGADASALSAVRQTLVGQGVNADYAKLLVARYGLDALSLSGGASTSLGECFDNALSEREIDYLRDHEWANSVDAVLSRRTKAGLLLTPAGKLHADAAIKAALK